MAEELKSFTTGLPSDFLDPQVKQSKEYSLAWAEAVDGRMLSNENPFFGDYSRDYRMKWTEVLRAYANGSQPIHKYKPILGIKDKKTANDPNESYKVLNWEILPIAPKFVNLLVGKLISQSNEVGVRAIDKSAVDERRQKKIELQEYLITRPYLDQISQQTGIPFQQSTPGEVGPIPQTVQEVDAHQDMFYKEKYCIAVQDMLNQINAEDNYEDIKKEVAQDLVSVGVGITKTYRVGNKIKRRRCVRERCVSSSSMKSLNDDIKFFGEYWDLTIGQLKEIAGDQFTEAQYRDISEKCSGKVFSGNVSDFFTAHHRYPWDNTKITVLDLIWFSPDWETHQVGQNQFGNVAVSQKEYSWWESLRKKNVTEQSFNKLNNSKVVRFALDNQYQCMWIKGTKYVFNHGKSKDMLKNNSSLGKTVSPFTIYKLDRSVIDILIPVFDSIQIDWLQHQHHLAKSRPSGVSVEFTALQDISLAGSGGKALAPKEVLKIYMETGILLWRRRDAMGNLSNWQPIQELKNEMSTAALQHLNNIVTKMNLLRDLIGLNELTDASTPNSEMGKAVANLAAGASEQALKTLHFAFDQINLLTHEKTVMHITGMAASGLAPHYTEALGMDEMATLGLLSDLTHHELGVYMVKAPTAEMLAKISMYINEGVKSGSLRDYEAIEIEYEKDKNIHKAIRLMKMYWGQKQRDAQAQSSQQIQENAQAQAQSNQAAEEAKQAGLMQEWQMKGEFEWTKAQAQAWANKQKASDDAFLLTLKGKIDQGIALSEMEQDRLTKLLVVEKTGQYQLAAARMKPKQSASK